MSADEVQLHLARLQENEVQQALEQTVDLFENLAIPQEIEQTRLASRQKRPTPVSGRALTNYTTVTPLVLPLESPSYRTSLE